MSHTDSFNGFNPSTAPVSAINTLDREGQINVYVAVRLTERLDDFDSSPSTIQYRDERFATLNRLLSDEDLAEAESRAEKLWAQQTHYASGEPIQHFEEA